MKVRGARSCDWDEVDQARGGAGLDKRKIMGNSVYLPTRVKFNSKPVNEETDNSGMLESVHYHQERVQAPEGASNTLKTPHTS